MRAAASRTFWTAGTSSATRIAMIAITTTNSMSVKAEGRRPVLTARHRAARLAGAARLPGPRVAGAAAGAARALLGAGATAGGVTGAAGGHRHAERRQQVRHQRQAGGGPAAAMAERFSD